MRLVYHRKIGTRLGCGFGIVVVLTILLGITALVEMNTLADSTIKLHDHPMAVISTIGDIRAEIDAVHLSMEDVMFAKTDEQKDAAKDRVSEHEQNALNSFRILSERFLGDEHAVEAAQKAFLDWRPVRQEIIELVNRGRGDEALEISRGKEAKCIEYVNESLQTMRDSAVKRAETFFIDAQNSRRLHIRVMSGLILLIIGICILSGRFITRSITEPVRYVIGEMRKVAGGNLNHKINLKSSDEIGQLAQAFDDMTGNLKKTIASRDEFDAANQQLQASQQQLKAVNRQLRELAMIVEQTAEGVAVANLEGKLRFVNTAWAKMHGYGSRDELIGKNLSIFHSDEQMKTDVIPFNNEAKRSGSNRSEVGHIRKDGTAFPTEMSATVFKDETGKPVGLIGLAADISSRKRTEEKIKIFSSAVESAYDSFVLTDMKGNVSYANKSAIDVFGYTSDEVTNLNVVKFTANPEDAKNIVTSALQHSKWNGEVNCVRKNKEEFPVILSVSAVTDEKGKAAGTMGIFRDITEHKKEEETRKQLVAILEATPDFVGFADAKDKHIVYINKSGRKMIGIGEDEDVTKLKINDVHPAWTNKMFADEVFSTVVRDGVWTGECAFLNIRDGHEIPVLMVLSSHKAPDGEIKIFSTISRDITEHKQTEDSYRRQNALLENIINSSPDFIFAKDIELRSILCNEAYAAAVGKKPAELIGHTDIESGWDPELVHGNPAKGIRGFENDDRDALSGKTIHNPNDPANTPNGVRIFDTYKIPLSLHGENKEIIGMLGISRDITDRKRMEDALRIEKDNLKAIFASSPVGMLLLDEETMIVDANSIIASMVSREPGQVIGQRGGCGLGCVNSFENEKGCGFARLCPECPLRKGILQVLTSGTSVRGVEMQLTLLINGQEQRPWLSISAEPVILDGRKYVIVAVDNITKRKQAEKYLQETTDKLISMADQISNVMKTVGEKVSDGASLHFENSDLVRCYEVKNCTKTACPCYNSTEPTRCWETAGTFCKGKVQGFFAKKLKDCQKCEVYQQARRNPICNLGESFNEMMLILEGRQQNLDKVNLELKDFAYIISHDLKAPLRGISIVANWLSDDYGDKLGKEGKEQIDLLLKRVKRMQNLIDGVLQYSRVGRVDEEKVQIDLNQLVPEIIDTVAAPENIEITIENQMPVIEASRTRITQVFQNLLSNAVKFMDKPEGYIRISSVEEDGFWKFGVADNGPGIEEKNFEKIFKID